MAQKITVDIDGDVSKLLAAVGQANSAVGGIGGGASGQQMVATGKSLTRNVTLPLVAVAAAGVKTAADFEVTMASLGVNAGIGGKDLARLGDLAIQLGADTVFSANEAAAAMLELSKAGLKPAAIEGGALANTLNLAATEGIALTEAATIMANSMNQFGLSAKDTTKITDILAAGAVASTTSIAGLAGGLKYVGTTANSLGVPLIDTVTSLAALNNAGIDATTAGTSLNRMLLGLAAPTHKSGQLMQYLGLEFTDANGNMKDMNGIIDELTPVIEGMGDAEKAATLKTLFGVEGMRAANVLLDLNTTGYNKLRGEVDKNGIAADLANARMDGMAGALETLKGSAETAALKIGKALEPAITIASTALTIAINLFTALPGPIQSVIVGVGAFIAILGPVIWLIGALKTSTTLSTIALLAKQAALGLVTAAQWLWNAAMSANPIGLVIIAIVAIIAIIVLLVKNWDTVTEVLGKVWEKIKNFASDAWEALKGFGSKVAGFVTGIVDKFKELPGAMLSVGKNIVTGLWDGIQNMASWLKDKVTGFFKNLIPSWAEKALGISSPSKVFASIGKNIVGGLQSTFNAPAIKSVSTKAQTGISIPKLSLPSTQSKPPIAITINAGLGTNGSALGRQVSSAIKQYGKVSTKAGAF